MKPSELASLVRDRKLLIADAEPVHRAYLLNLAVEMGFDTRKIYMAKDRLEALHFVSFEGTRTILFDDSMGMGLLDEIQTIIASESMQNVFIFLLCANTSQAGVGRAVEADVDAFSLKPFAGDELKASFLKSIGEKIVPSEFNKVIGLGRTRLFQGDYEQAEKLFEKAKTLQPEPSTAHFYAGQAKLMRKLLTESKNEFKQGLMQNQIHCQCLKAMYTLLEGQGKAQESYEVLRRLVGLFPESAERLRSAIYLAVKTGNFTDAQTWFEVYEGQEEKTEDVRIAIGAALAVLGRYYLISENADEAIESFEKALSLGVKKEVFLTYAVESLQKYGHSAEATRFMEAHGVSAPTLSLPELSLS